MRKLASPLRLLKAFCTSVRDSDVDVPSANIFCYHLFSVPDIFCLVHLREQKITEDDLIVREMEEEMCRDAV
jgi:hypothetical protein